MYDYHTHTHHSEDCNIPMKEMIESAISKGIKEMAITDHYDPDYPNCNYEFTIKFPNYYEELEEKIEQYKNKIKILKGLEIGIQHGGTMGKCRFAANNYNYDFLLGSFHCAKSKDLYFDYFRDVTLEQGFTDYYEYMYDCLQNYDDFDILGHINVLDRYAPSIPPYAPYMETIEAILKTIVEKGKGIEINTSSFRYGMGNITTPTSDILKIYKNLGGELVTIGSDSHYPKDLGDHFDWAVDFLKAHGFKYLSTFEKRKLKQIRL